jgi:hypothetical protein
MVLQSQRVRTKFFVYLCVVLVTGPALVSHPIHPNLSHVRMMIADMVLLRQRPTTNRATKSSLSTKRYVYAIDSAIY